MKTPILLITAPGREEETAMRLTRVGFDHLLGHLSGGFETWAGAGKEVDTVNRISPQIFEAEWNKETYVLDVRKETEYAAEHVDEAYNKPLDCINSWFMEMDDSKPFYMHCAGGYRSMIAASILKSRGSIISKKWMEDLEPLQKRSCRRRILCARVNCKNCLNF